MEQKTHLMAIVNITEDSFSDGGRYLDLESAVNHSLLCVEEGANIHSVKQRLMNNYFCEGEYTLTLDGPPGTTVTLYGQFFFEDDLGSLTLTKTDDRQVWIWDLEDFPDRKWVVAGANRSTGGYEVSYRSAPNFKMHLGSVKWDEIP